MTDPRVLRGTKRRGRKKQNHVLVQQLANGQYLLTIPALWIDILGLKKGDEVTFIPGSHNGVELVPSKPRRRSP